MIAGSPMLWDPIRYTETCPSSDGACAHGAARATRRATKAPHKPAWVHAHRDAQRADDVRRRDQVNPRAGRDCAAELYKKAGITDPRKEIDVRRDLRAVQLVRADVDGEPRLRAGRRGLEDDRTRARPRSTATCRSTRSGGVLSSNPIGASGMLRFAEAAMQVRGQAGEHQVDGAQASRSATPTAAARSSSRCGSSEASGRDAAIGGADRGGRGALRERALRARRRHGRRRSASALADGDAASDATLRRLRAPTRPRPRRDQTDARRRRRHARPRTTRRRPRRRDAPRAAVAARRALGGRRQRRRSHGSGLRRFRIGARRRSTIDPGA